MTIESYLARRRAERDILLMTHIVLGYPSFEDNLKIIEAMVAEGVDLMELQIPSLRPAADGPVIARANRLALRGGATVKGCLTLAAEATRNFDIPFLMMSYYDVLRTYGVKRFASAMADCGLCGSIVPDVPIRSRRQYRSAMETFQLAAIDFFSPAQSADQMKTIAACARGFIYCIARKGRTGESTEFSEQLGAYLQRCRRSTSLALALGFGIQHRKHVDFLIGKADIAVVGSQSIRVMEQRGIAGVGDFVSRLR